MFRRKRTGWARALQAVGLAGLVAMTAGLVGMLVVFRPAPREAPAVTVEPLARPVLADVTRTGRVLVRGRRGVSNFEDDALVVRTTGPVTPELLERIRSTRTDEDLIYVLAYDNSGPWRRNLLYQEYRYTPDAGWVDMTARSLPAPLSR